MIKPKCPDSECISKKPSPTFKSVIRKGRFFRKSDGQWISRYRCLNCGRNFSAATFNLCFMQKKRKLNFQINLLLDSAVSQRGIAKILGINRKIVVRKFQFLAEQSRIKHQKWINGLNPSSIRYVQFDDLETSEHSKCKPLSVSLAVEPKTRKILNFQVSRMPAKGHLAVNRLPSFQLPTS